METKQPESIRNIRRPIGLVSTITVNFFHLRNPWVTAAWSALFPGFGFIIMGSYIKGFLLVGWEFLINSQAHLNTAIFYSFTGQFDLAREVLNVRWTLLYLTVWVFSIWSSYTLTVDLNKLAILGTREKSTMVPVAIDAMSINFLDTRQPWIAAGLSMLSPGLGHLYTHRIPTSFFLMIMLIATVYYSHLLEAIQYTSSGAFGAATLVLDPQWLLFIPSLYGFAIYDSYVNTVEYNKLFAQEQARFLRDNYQRPRFRSRLTALKRQEEA
ncbi:MAG: hypothetical protein ABRQ24_02165 [Syntrophomonadaceae bacterium]